MAVALEEAAEAEAARASPESAAQVATAALRPSTERRVSQAQAVAGEVAAEAGDAARRETPATPEGVLPAATAATVNSPSTGGSDGFCKTIHDLLVAVMGEFLFGAGLGLAVGLFWHWWIVSEKLPPPDGGTSQGAP
jgi:hypothetical protein